MYSAIFVDALLFQSKGRTSHIFVKKAYLAYFGIKLVIRTSPGHFTKCAGMCQKSKTMDQGKAKEFELWHSNDMERPSKPLR